jgi:hypothetical protein
MSVELLVMNALRNLEEPVPEGPRVVITRCGGMFKARYAGHKDSTLGTTEQEAIQRLSRLHKTGCRTPEYRKRERA